MSAPFGGGMAQRAGCPVHINSTFGGGLVVKPGQVPHDTDSKNPLKHLSPRHQEHLGTDEKGMEAPTDLDELAYSVGGLVGHVILPLM
jgi:hypothetical protein